MLTYLANFYNSDKGDKYACAHYYTLYYQEILNYPIFKDKFSLLELGLNRDGTHDIPSLRMWKDYLKDRVDLWGFDINHQFKEFEREGFNIVIGDSSDPSCLIPLKQRKYSLIIDDASHASSHQQIALKELWDCVTPGGIYVIEDLHWQPFPESCIKTVDLAKQWISGNFEGWEKIFNNTLEEIKLFPSFSKLHPQELTKEAFLILRKKNG